MYNNPYYMNAYNSQANLDRINNQMNELEKMKQQIQQSIQQPQQAPNINQTFQINSQTPNNMRFANSLEEVQRDAVLGDTPYFSKDMSVVWIKNIKGEIKTYELSEIIPLDEKDLQIKYLQEQIEDLKKEMNNNEQFISNDDETSASKTDGAVRATTKKSEPTSVSTVSKRKAE